MAPAPSIEAGPARTPGGRGLTRALAVAVCLASLNAPAVAAPLEYVSTAQDGVILYDAPNVTSRKAFVVSRDYPLEVVVSLPDWMRVRDASGGMAWVERKATTTSRRHVQVMARTEVRQSADANAAVVFTADKDVLLERVEAPVTGWVKVRHASGRTGFARITQVWGW